MVHAGPTARKALELFVQSVPAEVSSQVVAILGFNGSPEPNTWSFLVRQSAGAGGLIEYRVEDGALRPPRNLPPQDAPEGLDRPLPPRTLPFDSHDVARLIDDEIILEGVHFARLDYQLCWRDIGPEPLWMATLVGHRGETLGHFFVSSLSGVITHRAFYHNFPRLPLASSPGANTPSPGTANPDTGSGPITDLPGQVKATSKPASTFLLRHRLGLSPQQSPPVEEVSGESPGKTEKPQRPSSPPYFKRR